LVANLTQQVSISKELNILFWNNKKSDTPQHSTTLQFKLSRVTCWLSVCTTSAEGLLLFSQDGHKPGPFTHGHHEQVDAASSLLCHTTGRIRGTQKKHYLAGVPEFKQI